MKNQFTTCEIAHALKELGFDEQCLGVFLIEDVLGLGVKGDIVIRNFEFHKNSEFTVNTLITAPLWQQAIDWFRENHYIYIAVLPYRDDFSRELFWYYALVKDNDELLPIRLKAIELGVSFDKFNTYHEAREEAILEAIKILKDEYFTETKKN